MPLQGALTGTCPAPVGSNFTGCDASMTDAWVATIKRLRNFPSVFDYTMDNEDIYFHLAKQWYGMAKQLDPTRFVNTADGVCCGEGPLGKPGTVPGPVDFRSAMCCGPIFLPKPYHFSTQPTQPAITHETGNFNSFPHLNATMKGFATDSAVKPWWLIETIAQLKANGLYEDSALWADRSDNLYMLSWKMLTEAMRKSTYVSGYEWWLLQEYFGVGDGILDVNFQPKIPEAQLQAYTDMNAPVVLLLAQPEDDLPIADELPRFLTYGYTSNQTLNTSVHTSNYGIAALQGVKLSWQVVGFNSKTQNVTICSDTQTIAHVHQGPPTTLLANISCKLPDLGSFHSSPQTPLNLRLRVQLADATGAAVSANTWKSRLYPLFQAGPAPVTSGASLYTTASWCKALPFTNVVCGIPPSPFRQTHQTSGSPGVLPKGSVIVVSELNKNVMDHAAAGATVLLLNWTHPPTPPPPPPPVKSCPVAFPYPDQKAPDICYNSSSYAAAGTGPCSSWCEIGTKPAAGCGQLCPPSSCPAAFPYPDQKAPDVCYTQKAYAAVGSGPCDSWCRIGTTPPAGCGKLCPAHLSVPALNDIGSVSCQAEAFNTTQTRFVSSWWIGQWSTESAKSSGVVPGTLNNVGTVVYNEKWPSVFSDIAADGWCDETWFR